MADQLPDLSILRRCWPKHADVASTHQVLVNGERIGGERPVVIAGPCAVESRDGILSAARAVARGGARMLRGGAFKPRTSPYSFQGLGYEGLDLLRAAGDAYELPVITEVLRPEDVARVSLETKPFVTSYGAYVLEPTRYFNELLAEIHPYVFREVVSAEAGDDGAATAAEPTATDEDKKDEASVEAKA